MRITTKGRYGLVIMLYLANHYKNDEYITLKEISESENISLKYLEKIMISLNKSDFLKSLRGSDGGYKLAYEPKNYTIKEILNVSEGNLDIVTCLNSEHECPKKDNCSSIKLWKGLNDVIDDYLSNKTLADFMEE
ncbi:MAG: Rrf2 family transcriptional regulator [Bacilli bacterium]|nr:Rrf2 family transcriptional regulator [Bacilli bacterium]